MNYGTSTKLLLLNLLSICNLKVVTSTLYVAKMPRMKQFNHLEEAEVGSGYEQGIDLAGHFGSNSRSLDDYDDEGLSSGWESSGDYQPVPADNFCAFPGLKSRRSGNKIQLPVALEDLCGAGDSNNANRNNNNIIGNNINNREVEARKRCLKAVCQCFAGDETYSVHFDNNFAIECIATNGQKGHRSTFMPPRVRNTAPPPPPSNGTTDRFSTDYDEDGDDDDNEEEEDDDYTVEIDRSRVLDEEKSGSRTGIMSKTGLLASIMGGTIIGLLCAVLLSMFIVYRIKRNRCSRYDHHHHHLHHSTYNNNKSPQCPPLKGYTKNFDDCDYYA